MKSFPYKLAVRLSIIFSIGIALLTIQISVSVPVPFFVYNTTTPNEEQKYDWGVISQRGSQPTMNLGFAFDKSDPSAPINQNERPMPWSYDDIKTLKNHHFDGNSLIARYVMFMILRMVDFQTAKKISSSSSLNHHLDAMGETKIPTKNSKGRRGADFLLKDVFNEEDGTISMTFDSTKTDIGALFLLASRYYTEKYFFQHSGINNIWGIMEYLSKLFLKKAILNKAIGLLNNPYGVNQSLLPSNSELAFLMGQYASIMEYRDLLLSGRQPEYRQDIQLKSFSGFNSRMHNNLMADLKGAIYNAGLDLFSENINEPVKGISVDEIKNAFPDFKRKFLNEIQSNDLLAKNTKDQFIELFGEEMKKMYSLYNIKSYSSKDAELQLLMEKVVGLETKNRQASLRVENAEKSLQLNENQSQQTISLLRQQLEILQSQCRYKPSNSLGRDEECAICLDAFEDGSILGYSNDCTHYLHINCWQALKTPHGGSAINCPLCRVKIDFNNIKYNKYKK